MLFSIIILLLVEPWHFTGVQGSSVPLIWRSRHPSAKPAFSLMV